MLFSSCNCLQKRQIVINDVYWCSLAIDDRENQAISLRYCGSEQGLPEIRQALHIESSSPVAQSRSSVFKFQPPPLLKGIHFFFSRDW